MAIKFSCPSCGKDVFVSPDPPRPALTFLKEDAAPAVQLPDPDLVVTNLANAIPRSKSVPQANPMRSGVVIHHSGTAMSAGGSNPKAYARYHVEDKGWPCIGYHFVIQPDGKVYQTLDFGDKGYHAGDVNGTHFGVCFSGDFDREDVPEVAFEAGAKLVAKILREHVLPNADKSRRLIRHSDVAQKTCPGDRFPWSRFTSRVAELLK